jgi:hypothetical protein
MSRTLRVGYGRSAVRYAGLLGAVLASWSASASAKVIDLATMSEPGGYEISFCARTSPDTDKPGHAFVAFSKKADNNKREFLSIGHTVGAGTSTASASWSYFGSAVPGVLKEEIYTSIRQNCLTAKVNSSDYASAKALTTSPLAKMGIGANGPVIEAYKLGANDCMTFLSAVAQTLVPRGLKVPVRGATELPMDYIERFIAAN